MQWADQLPPNRASASSIPCTTPHDIWRTMNWLLTIVALRSHILVALKPWWELYQRSQHMSILTVSLPVSSKKTMQTLIWANRDSTSTYHGFQTWCKRTPLREELKQAYFRVRAIDAKERVGAYLEIIVKNNESCVASLMWSLSCAWRRRIRDVKRTHQQSHSWRSIQSGAINTRLSVAL